MKLKSEIHFFCLLISGGTLAKLVYFEPTDSAQLEQRSPEDQEVNNYFYYIRKCYNLKPFSYIENQYKKSEQCLFIYYTNQIKEIHLFPN